MGIGMLQELQQLIQGEDLKVQAWSAGALYSLSSAEDAAGAKLKHQAFKVQLWAGEVLKPG